MAIEDYERAIILDPNDAATYFNRGIAYRRKGRYDAAISDFSEAILREPGNGEAYFGRGLVYLEKDEYIRAGYDFQKACDMGHKGGCEGLETIDTFVKNQKPPRRH